MSGPLEDLLANAPGLLVLLFSAGTGPEEERARAAARALARRHGPDGRPGLLVELTFAAHKSEAAALGIHGYPAVAIFWEGRLLFTALGATQADRLARRLESRGEPG